MSDADAVLLVALWAAWSLAWAAARLKHIAASLSRLVALAERGRP